MAQVPQKTLSWLWNVLQPEYLDPQRTYADTVQVLSFYPSLAPRTNAYTFDNGSTALLLKLGGTIPVNYRGTEYRFPISIWLPQRYPVEPPMVFVAPSGDLIIRPGQHVSGSDGKIYHPYLARWRDAPERTSLADLVRLLAEVFARDPPVMSRQQPAIPQQMQQPPPAQRPTEYRPPPSHTQSAHPPPRPPAPGQQIPATSRQPSYAAAPPPPPKPYDQAQGPRPASIVAERDNSSSRLTRYEAPPPLPGQGREPPPRPVSTVSSPPSDSYQRQYTAQTAYPANTNGSYPPQMPPQQSAPQYMMQSSRRPNDAAFIPPQQTAMPPQIHSASYSQGYPPQQQPPQQHHPAPLNQPSSVQQTFQPHPHHHQLQPQSQVAKKPNQPNIMDDSPFDVNLSATNANLPTPAIPPNPEKQQLLQALQSTLLSNLNNQIAQSASALAPLQSQQNALSSTQYNLQQELESLENLQASLKSNVSSLSSTLAAADRTVASAKNSSSPDKTPAIDEMIIAPTVVARQLYDSVADQRGYEAAIYALTEAFVRGRIGGELWSRKTRECAREEFRRKWLVKRIGKGMGLDVPA